MIRKRRQSRKRSKRDLQMRSIGPNPPQVPLPAQLGLGAIPPEAIMLKELQDPRDELHLQEVAPQLMFQL
jgi:hypothetical protein